MTGVRGLREGDFHALPGFDFVGCAYGTDTRYGGFTLFIGSMSREEYDTQYRSDPLNTLEVKDLGEQAAFHACAALTVFRQQLVLDLEVQFANCKVVDELISLARIALRTSGRAA
ncbi:MAG: hypothetical protein ABR600_04105 [Actinomycetota bacterium]